LLDVRPLKPCLTAREMRLAYLPGAAFVCDAVASDPEAAFRYSGRGNLVAVVTNGTAVPGRGEVGALAAKPLQEGMALLFKRLADIDVFDLELDTLEPDRFVETVRTLEPGFGGVVLSHVRAPDGLAIYDRLCEVLHIPVFHENLQSTAVVAMAALSNAIELAGKRLDSARVVICGGGTVGLGCARLARRLGIGADNLLVYDVGGLLHPDRDDLTTFQRAFARAEPERTLEQGLRGADVFIGASAGGVMRPEMVRSMGRFPVVLALASPEPEILYDEARACRHDVIVATSVATSPNAVLDLLSFPYIMRGALDVHATRITDGMLLAAAAALAELAREDVIDEVSRVYGSEHLSFGPEYLLPKPIDPRILVRQSAAVAQRAVEEGIAAQTLDVESYQERLRVRIGTGRETLRRLMVKARRECPRVVFPEACHPTILRASSILAEEGVARPILLGSEREVRDAIGALALDASHFTIIDPLRSLRREHYAEGYFQLRQRSGVMRATAIERVRQPEYFAAMMLVSGDADLTISGVGSHYADSMRVILEVIGTAPGVRRISSHYLVLLPRGDVYFLADCAVNIDPDAAGLAEIALLTAGRVRALGLEPHVAMLSFSNFGSVDHPLARKVRHATDLVKSLAPDLNVDGEMQLATAVRPEVREEYFPFARLRTNANVFIFPDLQSGNLAMHLLQHIGEGVVTGPVLMGTRLPAHLLQYGSSVDEVVNLAVVGIVEAAGLRDQPAGPA
jgi:malate dehydrogenase (oxaloacetate-decarboxylating)(NADP+)